MVIDNFTFHVSRVWYRVYYGFAAVLNVAVVVGYLLWRYAPGFTGIGEAYNLDSPIALILSLIALVYLLSIYWLLAKRSLPMASLIGTALTTLGLLHGISSTDPQNTAIPYLALWLITIFLNGIYGLLVLLGSALVSSIYLLLQNELVPASISIYSWIMLGGSALLAAIGYPFWRSRFVTQQEQQMSMLSGMLRSTQEQSAILIQSITDGVIVINTEGKITLINPAAGLMTQWSVAEATGLDVELVVKLSKENGEPMEKEESPFAIALRSKQHTTQTAQLTGRKGKKQIVSLVMSPIIVGGKNMAGVAAVVRDISEERAAEQQRAEFISTASHEMRTPVAAIEGYLALALNEKVSTIDSRARGYLEKAHSSTQHLGQLFQDLLTSAKAEDGRLSNHPAVIEMGAYLEQLVEDLRFGAQKKGLAAEFVVGSGQAIDATSGDGASKKVVKPLYYIYADPDRLREAITNLFDNAVKYTDQGKVSIGLTGNNEVVQLYIRDTGAGIPAEDIPHLFQKFYRVDSSATRTVGGTGLGLFICRKIIELYQGRIWVESMPGKGSTFFINIPRLDASRAQSLQQQALGSTPPLAR
ncbi:MAG TPA: ATP-binding protein [Candidatus Saccharimonadales bacterium]|nr:ATP-binding protein [Candidatus Saccharimonadales bacterium]